MDLVRIREGYRNRVVTEWERLISSPIRRIEHLITSDCLRRYLPGTGMILDAGCGPGRYAIQLAMQGYRIICLDPIYEMPQFARGKLSEASVQEGSIGYVSGNIAALPFSSNIFDAVVCLGASLSHLVSLPERVLAIEELMRVTCPGGRIFVTGLTYMGFFRGSVYWGDWELFDQLKQEGFRSQGIVAGSHLWHAFAPGELETLLEKAGLFVIDRVGCEGIANHLPQANLETLENDPSRWPAWQKLLLETCRETAAVSISNHLLVVCEKSPVL